MNGDPLILGTFNNNATQSTQLTANQPNPAFEAINSSGAGVVGSTGHDSGQGVGGYSNAANGGRGVYGRSDGPNGAGVEGNWFATNRGTGTGVHGVSNGPAAADSGSWAPGSGVLGESNAGDGVAGISTGGSSADGVHGIFGGPAGTRAQTWARYGSGVLGEANSNDSSGVSGISGLQTGTGVYGASPGAGVVGVLTPQNASTSGAGVIGVAAFQGNTEIGYAGVFWGKVMVVSDLTVFGAKSAAVKHPDGSHRLLYCMESPESWFEDFGEARLMKGRAAVKLPKDFRAVIKTHNYHVFISAYGPSGGLYVSKRTSTGFVVQEQGGGKSNVKFSYRIVARRKDVNAKRLARVAPPRLPRLAKRSARPRS